MVCICFKQKELDLYKAMPNKKQAFLWILQELYDNGVICLQYKNSMLLKELITKGEIKVESSLLSKPEWEYFE